MARDLASTLALGSDRLPAAQRAAPAGREPDRNPLTHRRRPLPTLGIEVGAAKRTTSGERRDVFSALWAMAGMHVNRIPPCDHGPINEISGLAKNVCESSGIVATAMIEALVRATSQLRKLELSRVR
jgi:hypothetical protein